jgi:transcriptional regulator with XRE-family HTH domain
LEVGVAKTRERTPTGVSRVVGRQVKTVREQLLLSQADLAQRLRDLDVRIDQATIARLETGSRRISVDEVLALAVALGVNPLFLFAASFTRETVQVTPTITAGPQLMLHWFRGEGPLPGTDEECYFELIPEDERLRQRRYGVQHLQQCMRDYMDAATARDHDAMVDAIRDLKREIERQSDQLARDDRKAKKGESRG